MKFRVFHPRYKSKATGAGYDADTHHIAFRDHKNRRQTVTASTRESTSRRLAERLKDLVELRRSGDAPDDKLQRWIDSLSPKLSKRLIDMDLIDARTAAAGVPLSALFNGEKDADGKVSRPGYRQAVAARGVTGEHLKMATDRVEKILDGCAFHYWSDLLTPGAETRVSVYLAGLRDAGQIGGNTLNYYVRDFKSFCRWLAKEVKARTVPMADLAGVDNAESDSEVRRALSVAEMPLLMRAAAAGADHNGLAGDERALLYRFAFETGIRPGQLRSLTVADFDLDTDPPTVRSAAQYVKRRREHIQVLRPGLAADLKARFKNKLPGASALKLPSKFHMATMLRKDLAVARATWISEAKTDAEREERQRSDFLAAVNHRGERAVFYSTRHGHGTALADAGVPEKDIAASMHHSSRAITARYLHTDRTAAKSAIEAMPDLSYPAKHVATGTDDRSIDGQADALRNRCADSRRPVAIGGDENPVFDPKTAPGRGGTADATDLKSASDARQTPISAASDAMDDGALRKRCADSRRPMAIGGDAEKREAIERIGRLEGKELRQVLALLRSMTSD